MELIEGKIYYNGMPVKLIDSKTGEELTYESGHLFTYLGNDEMKVFNPNDIFNLFRVVKVPKDMLPYFVMHKEPTSDTVDNGLRFELAKQCLLTLLGNPEVVKMTRLSEYDLLASKSVMYADALIDKFK